MQERGKKGEGTQNVGEPGFDKSEFVGSAQFVPRAVLFTSEKRLKRLTFHNMLPMSQFRCRVEPKNWGSHCSPEQASRSSGTVGRLPELRVACSGLTLNSILARSLGAPLRFNPSQPVACIVGNEKAFSR
jgi:hypothetical protein